MKSSKSQRKKSRLKSFHGRKKVQPLSAVKDCDGQLISLKQKNAELRSQLAALRHAAKATTIVKQAVSKVVVIRDRKVGSGAGSLVTDTAVVPTQTLEAIQAAHEKVQGLMQALSLSKNENRENSEALHAASREISRLKKALALSQSESRRLLESAQQQMIEMRRGNAKSTQVAPQAQHFDGFEEVLAMELASMREGFEVKLAALQEQKDALGAQVRVLRSKQ